MDYKEIIRTKKTKEIIAETISEIYEFVAYTFGPNGNTVIIPSSEDYLKFDITKDGVSVVKQIKFKDPIKNIIAQFVKDCADRSVKAAGDGTTTATILMCSMILKCIDNEYPSKRINDAFNEIIPKVLSEIDKMKKNLKNNEIKKVINISCNGDNEITENIYSIIKNTSNIKLHKHTSNKDIIVYDEGLVWDTSYKSKHFVNNLKKESVEYDNANVLILDGKMLDIKAFKHIINSLAENNKPLVIVTEHIHENVLRVLENLYLSRKLDVVVIKSPGMSEHRKNLLNDLAAFTGATIIKGDTVNTVTLKDLGIVKNIISTKTKTTFVKDDSINVSEYINNLKEQLKNPIYPDYVKQLFDERIRILEGSLGVIYVGGNSDAEITERFDRYDDAIKAIISAKEDGVLIGGGSSLYTIANKLKGNYEKDSIEYNILCSLESPYNKLKSNGTDVDNLKNVIDPTKVIKTALINASSSANILLGTKGILLTNTF